MYPVYTAHFYTNPKYTDDSRTITDKYDSPTHMHVEQLIQCMEGYIVNNEIIYDNKERLIEALLNKNYDKFYKIIAKMAKKARKNL